MRITLKPVAALLLPVLLVASPAFAQQSRVLDATVLQQAIAEQATLEATQRASIQRVLELDEAKRLAGEMGLDLADARTAVSTLSGRQLAQAAEQAAAAEVAIAGGATVVAISLTTLLLIIIIVILLAQ
jgi:hypothetical protein